MLSMAETIISENAITNGVRSPVQGVFADGVPSIVFLNVLLYGIRKPESDQWLVLFRQNIAADKSVCSAVSVVKGVDVAEKKVEQRYASDRFDIRIIQNIERFLKAKCDLRFWLHSLVNGDTGGVAY